MMFKVTSLANMLCDLQQVFHMSTTFFSFAFLLKFRGNLITSIISYGNTRNSLINVQEK